MQIGAATILLTLIGPFGTFTDLTLPWRGLYWAAAILCGLRRSCAKRPNRPSCRWPCITSMC
jgi:hypothetical protein